LDVNFWKGKRVLLTGHTGFKGSWLTSILRLLGADVCGISLSPVTEPNLYTELKHNLDSSIICDINNSQRTKDTIAKFNPDIAFHLAAQPLVRYSYSNPVETYKTNVVGTANVLDSLRESGSIKSIVVVTTDKCYDNKEWSWPYRENDQLGGTIHIAAVRHAPRL